MLNNEHITLLRPGETLIMTLHRHWIILFFHFLYILILLIASWILLVYKDIIIDFTGNALYWGLLTIFWIIFLTFILLDWISDELDIFIITNMRIIGLNQISPLSRSVTECSLDRVQEVDAHTNGVLQTIFGYGEVHIHTASETSNMIVRYAPDPIESARRINNVITEYRSGFLNKNPEPPQSGV